MTGTPQPAVSVRPATPDDIEFMVRLFIGLAWQRSPTGDGVDTEAITHGTRQATLEQVQGKLADSITYVIECDRQQAGRLRVVRPAGHIEIAGLQVLPEVQRRGIGTAVVLGLLAEGVSKRLPVVLQVEKDNPDAERLYERLGFQRFDETPDGYWMRVPAQGRS